MDEKFKYMGWDGSTKLLQDTCIQPQGLLQALEKFFDNRQQAREVLDSNGLERYQKAVVYPLRQDIEGAFCAEGQPGPQLFLIATDNFWAVLHVVSALRNSYTEVFTTSLLDEAIAIILELIVDEVNMQALRGEVEGLVLDKLLCN